jgi:hypothetical protein
MSAAAGTVPVVHPFANAPVLPFAMGHDWFMQARSVWWRHVFFLAFATLVILVARWQLDLAERGVVIVLSYLSDAVVFTWVFLGLRESEAGVAKSPFAGGRQALRGRWRKVMLSSLWGLPAALASYLVFAFAPEAIKVLVLALGVNALGVAALVLVVMAGAYVTFLLCMLPVLAGVHAARDGGAGFKVGGLWAFRALRCGWRPLLVVFVAFIVACFVAGTALTWTFGHLPAAWFTADNELMGLLGYWYPWPGLLVAMNLFMALLFPMVSDLLAAADTDLSDEIASQAQKDLEGQRFVGHVWARAALLMRTAAAASVLFGLVYGAVFNDMGQFTDWFGVAVVFYVLGGGLYKMAAWARRTTP